MAGNFLPAPTTNSLAVPAAPRVRVTAGPRPAQLARPATAGVRMKSRTVLIAVAGSWLRAHGLISAGVTHVG